MKELLKVLRRARDLSCGDVEVDIRPDSVRVTARNDDLWYRVTVQSRERQPARFVADGRDLVKWVRRRKLEDYPLDRRVRGNTHWPDLHSTTRFQAPVPVLRRVAATMGRDMSRLHAGVHVTPVVIWSSNGHMGSEEPLGNVNESSTICPALVDKILESWSGTAQFDRDEFYVRAQCEDEILIARHKPIFRYQVPQILDSQDYWTVDRAALLDAARYVGRASEDSSIKLRWGGSDFLQVHDNGPSRRVEYSLPPVLVTGSGEIRLDGEYLCTLLDVPDTERVSVRVSRDRALVELRAGEWRGVLAAIRRK